MPWTSGAVVMPAWAGEAAQDNGLECGLQHLAACVQSPASSLPSSGL